MRDTGESLPATLVFDYPTLSDMATFLLAKLCPAAPTAHAETPLGQPVTTGSDDALREIEELSDEDVDRLLSNRLGGTRA
jgi:hypothetical protein